VEISFYSCIEEAVDGLVKKNCTSFSLQRLENGRNFKAAMQFVL